MSADLLARLVTAGTPADLVAEVAMTLARAGNESAAIERRREKDAARQKAKRERDKASRDITLCHDHHVTKRDEAPAPNKSPLETQKLTPTPHGGDAHAHEGPVGVDPSLQAILAGWLGLLTVTAAARKRRWPRTMPPPFGVSDDQWVGFLAMRKAMRKTLTDHAYGLLCGKLARLAEDGWPPGTLIDLAIENHWVTVWPPKDRQHGKRPHHDRPDDQPRSPLAAAAADYLAGRQGGGQEPLGG